MASYLQVSKDLVSCFDSFEITHIAHVVNSEVDRLSRIGSWIDQDLTYLVVSLLYSSIDQSLVKY